MTIYLDRIKNEFVFEPFKLYRKYNSKIGQFRYRLEIPQGVKPARLLSGHRAVFHAGMDEYNSKLENLLGYYSLLPEIEDNIFMKVGREYEGVLLKTQGINIQQFFYKDTKGDMFSHPELSGEIDGYDPSTNWLYECKTFYSMKRIEEDQYQFNKWYVQCLLYLYGWNLDVKKGLRKEVKGIKIIAYFVPIQNVLPAMKNVNRKIEMLVSPKVEMKNVYTFTINLDKQLEKDMKEMIGLLLLKRKILLEKNEVYDAEHFELLEKLKELGKVELINE